MDWRVGVMRTGEEDVTWIDQGSESSWAAARADAVDALRKVAAREGRQEYRVQVDDIDGIVTPGLDHHGVVKLDGLGESLPLEHA